MYRMKHTLILVAAALVLAACSQDEPAWATGYSHATDTRYL